MKAKHCALKTCMLNEPRSQGPQNCGNFRDQDVYGPELLWVFGVFGVLEGGEAVGSTFATTGSNKTTGEDKDPSGTVCRLTVCCHVCARRYVLR